MKERFSLKDSKIKLSWAMLTTKNGYPMLAYTGLLSECSALKNVGKTQFFWGYTGIATYKEASEVFRTFTKKPNLEVIEHIVRDFGANGMYFTRPLFRMTMWEMRIARSYGASGYSDVESEKTPVCAFCYGFRDLCLNQGKLFDLLCGPKFEEYTGDGTIFGTVPITAIPERTSGSMVCVGVGEKPESKPTSAKIDESEGVAEC